MDNTDLPMSDDLPKQIADWLSTLPPPATQILSAWISIFPELVDESDRGCVLIVHAFVDERLRVLLRAFLSRMSGSNNKHIDELLRSGQTACLGSYGHRVTMARSLGLIDEDILKGLRALNKVRIPFAHKAHTKLSSQEVNTIIDNLEDKRRLGLNAAIDSVSKGDLKGFDPVKHSSARQGFMLVAAFSNCCSRGRNSQGAASRQRS